jgi:hypothetical protein
MEPQNTSTQPEPQFQQPDTGASNQNPPVSAQGEAEENPDKSYLVALLLSYFFGAIGADRFYLGKIGTGILKLVTLGGLGIWHLVDLILVAFNKLHAKGDDRALEGYAHNRSWVKILAIVMIVFNVVVIGGGIILLVVFSAVPGLQKNSRDVQRKNDVVMTSSDLSQYIAAHHTYPTDEEFYNGSFMTMAPPSILHLGDMTYVASPNGCNGKTVPCTSYALSAKLENGSTYTVNP